MMLDLDPIKKRCEAATPGPWPCRSFRNVLDGTVSKFLQFNNERVFVSFDKDREFISTSREDIPALIAEIEQLRSKIADAKSILSRARGGRDGDTAEGHLASLASLLL